MTRSSSTKIPAKIRTAVVAATVTVAGVATLAPAQAEGLFDFLFGGAPSYPSRVVAYGPDPGVMYGPFGEPMRRRHVRTRHARPKLPPPDAALSSEDETSPPTKQPPPPPGKGPLGPFVNDPTLRPGDVVVTSAGLMVFRGEEDSHHSDREFVAVAKAGGLVAGRKSVLASIEKANRLMPATVETGQASPTDRIEEASAIEPKSRRHR